MNPAQEKTLLQYDEQLSRCRKIFLDKANDYGTNWRIMRVSSLTDQLFIKAQRIRSIEEKNITKIDEPVEGEYIGIVNYAVITIMQIQLGASYDTGMSAEDLLKKYAEITSTARQLMNNKNHDYGEAWREMYISSFTDLILSKILRIRNILENDGKTNVSEGIDSNLYDMINYALFALIRLQEKSEG